MTSVVSEFIEDGFCLLADPSIAFLTNIKVSLVNMGVPSDRILICTKYPEALRYIQNKKVKFLITEYRFNGSAGNGLSLVDALKKSAGLSDFISIMITSDSSEMIVAEAAEGQVDGFLIKPFSGAMLDEKILGAVNLKLHPSPYITTITEGKKLIAGKTYDEAQKVFEKAKALNEKPSLACYYVGLAAQLNSNTDRAIGEYREGRSYNPIHYLCLFGEFEILINSKRFEEADQLVTIIKQHYPITAYRLGQIIISLLFNKNFAALKECYQLLLKIDSRPKQLMKISTEAFLASGRHFLNSRQIPEAIEFFDMALIASGRNFETLEGIINNLIVAKEYREAESFLKKTSKHEIGSPRFNQLSFLVSHYFLPVDEFINRGRKLVFDGLGTPDIYKTLVKAMIQNNKITLAESVILKAVNDFPDLHKDLYGLLDSAVKKAA